MSWKPEHKKELVEVAGPLRRIRPRGLSSLTPFKQEPRPDAKSIECGNCHAVIYRADKKFDSAAFQAAKERHYSLSPECRTKR
jgi:hypothetical protein